MQGKIVFGLGGLILGLLIGFFGANSLNRDSAALAAGSSNSGVVSPQVTSAALDQLLERANAEPQNFVLQMQAGDMYAQIARYDQAIEFYKRGLILQPENSQANVVLANALFDSGRYEEAEPYYAKALSINENDVNARVDLGTTFLERSYPDHDRAIKEFSAARAKDPKNEAAIYYLGIGYLRKGDVETARNMIGELEKLNPTSPLIARLRQNIDSK
jgi:tetratricopeptide (TPR) repeat protein